MDRLTSRSRADARRLRAIERGVLATDAAWAREVFGDVARPRRRSRPALCAVLDVLALSLLTLGVVVALPLMFAGFVVLNVAVCFHIEGKRR